jgi:hypothetical protein
MNKHGARGPISHVPDYKHTALEKNWRSWLVTHTILPTTNLHNATKRGDAATSGINWSDVTEKMGIHFNGVELNSVHSGKAALNVVTLSEETRYHNPIIIPVILYNSELQVLILELECRI